MSSYKEVHGELTVYRSRPKLRDVTNSKLKTLDIGLTPNLEKLDLQKSYCLVELLIASECQKLAELKISHSNLRTLNLGMAPNLKKLDLKECRKLVELQTPPGCLKKLVHVDLSGCLRFRSFKFQIKSGTSRSVDESLEVGPLAELCLFVESIERCPLHPNNNMPTFWFDCVYKEDRPSLSRNLEILLSVGMCACTNVETFSRSICGLQCLRKLELKGSFLEVIKDLDRLKCPEELVVLSTHIKHLPDSIYMFKHLKSLKLTYCLLLETLPEDLGQLECLENLDSSHTKIKHLPDSICMLKRLKNLKLISCSLFEKLPEDLGQLECLENLDLSHTKIKHLPISICMLKRLKYLKLYDCSLFEKLPEDIGQLECLENLNLMSCRRLQDIPNSICEMKCLKYFNLYNCIRVEKLPEELGGLECLKELDVKGTSISHLPQSILLLKGLHISGLGQLLESSGFTPTAGISSTVLQG